MQTKTIPAPDIQTVSSFQSTLDFICQLESKKAKRLRQELKKMPSGQLYVNKSNGYIYFEQAINGQRRNISKDIDLVYRLARKRYVKLQLNEYDHLFSNGGKTIRLNSNSASMKARRLLMSYGEIGLDVMRITCSEEQYHWAHARYPQNTFDEEGKKYSTYSGIKVRSKSEQKIGNELELNGIPYRYEMGFSLYVAWMEEVLGMSGKGYKTYYPDFTILTATGDLILWEHLGRVDEKKYRSHNAEKISAYRQGSKTKDAMLILTFEADVQEAGWLQEIITCRVLPYV